jgi:hypothetical protein
LRSRRIGEIREAGCRVRCEEGIYIGVVETYAIIRDDQTVDFCVHLDAGENRVTLRHKLWHNCRDTVTTISSPVTLFLILPLPSNVGSGISTGLPPHGRSCGILGCVFSP